MLVGHAKPVNDMLFSRDGQMLATSPLDCAGFAACSTISREGFSDSMEVVHFADGDVLDNESQYGFYGQRR